MLTKIPESQLIAATRDGLTHMIQPTRNCGDLYRGNWAPGWFNQQHGGQQWGGLPDGSFGSVAASYIDSDYASLLPLAHAAAYTYRAQGFKVGEAISCSAIWLKVAKNNNPTNNLVVRILPDDGSGTKPTGNTPITNGTAVAQSGKIHTSNVYGEWVRFVFSTPVALAANTFYHVVASSSGAIDASNYWNLSGNSVVARYPFGNVANGDGTPAWTAVPGYRMNFIVENSASTSMYQSGGMFDHKLVFGACNPISLSKSIAAPLLGLFDGRSGFALYRGTYVASSTVFDMGIALDHDRVTLTVNSSGYPVATLLQANGTALTVTGTASITSGNHDVAVAFRSVGDGADYLKLLVDGASVGSPLTSQTVSFSSEMRYGSIRLGDGFGAAPVWTTAYTPTALPSALGWTWTGTGTEASCVSVLNNKLYQTGSGYTSTQSGYNSKTTSLSNATGWTVAWKARVRTDPNTQYTGSARVSVADGTKGVSIDMKEYYVEASSTGAPDFSIPFDCKSFDVVFTLVGKGSDYYLFANNKLLIDGTSKLTAANASNYVRFGDESTTASMNSDVVWSYVKYYQGGALMPTAYASTCSEFAFWSADKSEFMPVLWNKGTPLSVRSLAGSRTAYVSDNPVVRHSVRGMQSGPTTTSTTGVPLEGMEAYCLGSDISAKHGGLFTNATASQSSDIYIWIDGIRQSQSRGYGFAPDPRSVYCAAEQLTYCGLHRVNVTFGNTGSGTVTAAGGNRTLIVDVKG